MNSSTPSNRQHGNSIPLGLTLVFLLVVILLFSGAGQAATLYPAETGDSNSDVSSGSGIDLVSAVIGTAPEDGVLLLPFGLHTHHPQTGISRNNLAGIIYQSFYFGTFINSFDDRVWSLGVTRNFFDIHGIGLNYYLGLMVGYQGNLSKVGGIPFRHTLLFKDNLNPVATIDAQYRLTSNLELHAFLTPLVILTGLKFNF